MSNTPFDRIWDQHVVREYGGGRALIHIDRHFAQEGTSGRAFDGLRERGLKVRRPDLTVGTIDHGLSTLPGRDDRQLCREHASAILRCGRTVPTSA